MNADRWTEMMRRTLRWNGQGWVPALVGAVFAIVSMPATALPVGAAMAQNGERMEITTSAACPTPLASEPSLMLLSEIKALNAHVTTLGSRFVEERHLKVMNAPLISEGEFFYRKPDQLVWIERSPEFFGVSVKGSEIKRWRKVGDATETSGTQQNPFLRIFLDQVLTLMRLDFSKLEKEYTLIICQADPVQLRLEPRSQRQRDYISNLRVGFLPGNRFVETVEIHTSKGDFIRLRFSAHQVNTPMPEDFF